MKFKHHILAAAGFAILSLTMVLINIAPVQGRGGAAPATAMDAPSGAALTAARSATTAGNVHALFGLETPASGPFPSNWFTVADPSQNTRLRVNLPKPDCGARPSDCEDLDVINTLDGFNLQPRLSIPF